MTVYISDKVFFTKGIENGTAITSGVVPGLCFIVKQIEKDLVYLENIKTLTIIVVTKDMLESSLFIKK